MTQAEARPFRELWLSVLLCGLSDEAEGDTGWIGTPGFHRACVLAGFDASVIREAFERRGDLLKRQRRRKREQ